MNRKAQRKLDQAARRADGEVRAAQHRGYQRKLALWKKQRDRYSRLSAARTEQLIERAEALKAAYEAGELAAALADEAEAARAAAHEPTYEELDDLFASYDDVQELYRDLDAAAAPDPALEDEYLRDPAQD